MKVILLLLMAFTLNTEVLTYTSARYQYNIQYPQTWLLAAQEEEYISFTSPEKAADGSHVGLALSIETLSQDSITLDDVAGSIGESYTAEEIVQYDEDILIGALPAKTMVVMEEGIPTKLFFVMRGKEVFMFIYPISQSAEATQAVEQIVSSLSFS